MVDLFCQYITNIYDFTTCGINSHDFYSEWIDYESKKKSS